MKLQNYRIIKQIRHSLKGKIRNEHLRNGNQWIVLERKCKYKTIKNSSLNSSSGGVLNWVGFFHLHRLPMSLIHQVQNENYHISPTQLNSPASLLTKLCMLNNDEMVIKTFTSIKTFIKVLIFSSPKNPI